MELKELTQAELDEGLTVEFVNNTGFEKRHTPVLFSVDENPSGIMKCSTGYWRRTGDFQYEKDSKGRLKVYDERTCRIARARYLQHFAEFEKKEDTEKILSDRKKKIEEELTKIEIKIFQLKELRDSNRTETSTESMFVDMALSQMDENQRQDYEQEREAKIKERQELIDSLPRLEEILQSLIEEFKKGNYNYLLSRLGIEEIANPISFKYDNESDMNAAKAFTRTLIDTGDTNMAYARLKAEQSPIY